MNSGLPCAWCEKSNSCVLYYCETSNETLVNCEEIDTAPCTTEHAYIVKSQITLTAAIITGMRAKRKQKEEKKKRKFTRVRSQKSKPALHFA